jgi:hypothetical protein
LLQRWGSDLDSACSSKWCPSFQPLTLNFNAFSFSIQGDPVNLACGRCRHLQPHLTGIRGLCHRLIPSTGVRGRRQHRCLLIQPPSQSPDLHMCLYDFVDFFINNMLNRQESSLLWCWYYLVYKIYLINWLNTKQYKFVTCTNGVVCKIFFFINWLFSSLKVVQQDIRVRGVICCATRSVAVLQLVLPAWRFMQWV